MVTEFLFFTSKKEEYGNPELQNMTGFLQDLAKIPNLKVKIIDIEKRSDLAEKYKIMTIPTLLARGQRIIGASVDALFDSIEMKATIQTLTYKLGRKAAKKEKLGKFKETELIRKLTKLLKPFGVEKLKAKEINLKKTPIVLKAKFKKVKHLAEPETCLGIAVAGYLGGAFFEILDEPVTAIEKKCMKKGHEFCEFEIKKGN